MHKNTPKFNENTQKFKHLPEIFNFHVPERLNTSEPTLRNIQKCCLSDRKDPDRIEGSITASEIKAWKIKAHIADDVKIWPVLWSYHT